MHVYNFGAFFLYFFFLFFALRGNLEEATFLKDIVSEIADFKGPNVQEPPLKGSPKEGPKTTPKKTRTRYFWGIRVRSLEGLLGEFWGCLGAPCRCLAASWAKRVEKGSTRAAQQSPKEALDRPREAKNTPR